jgi:hypothetical protein
MKNFSFYTRATHNYLLHALYGKKTKESILQSLKCLQKALADEKIK